jgi:hypothetical protein
LLSRTGPTGKAEPARVRFDRLYPGGRTQLETRLNLPAPWYSKNWVWSLQTAGIVGYFPHRTLGAPSGTGPRNAFACFTTAAGVILFQPIAFSHLTTVSVWPNATGVHGSAVIFSCPYLRKTLLNGGTALSVRSKPRDDAIAHVHFG